MAWHLFAENNVKTDPQDYKEFMLDSPEDLTNGTEPLNSGCFGSICFTPGFKGMWQKAPSGEWVKMGVEDNA